MKKAFMLSLALCVLVAMGGFASGAKESTAKFPEKDITLIVPWSAGGGTDTIARALVKNAKNYLGVNVNVVNKTGGNGSIGMSAVATARPDGYTVGMITFNLSTYKMMGMADLSFRDFELLQLLNQSPAALSVKADSPFKTLDDLIKYVKANPGKVRLGHAGAGGAWHLAAAALAKEYGLQFNYIPFDGSAPTRSALLGGHVDVVTSGIDEMLQLYESKEVRILTVINKVRHPRFPEVPTIKEAGYPIENPVLDWRGLGLPKGVPADRVEILKKGFKQMFDDPEFRKFCEETGLVLVYADSKEFETFLANLEKVLEAAVANVGLLKK
ncbi:MAG: tripartite tricarboxylate transporter substrate binding protein [Spirochaetales bacterium]